MIMQLSACSNAPAAKVPLSCAWSLEDTGNYKRQKWLAVSLAAQPGIRTFSCEQY
jgi:hypothetical protein